MSFIAPSPLSENSTYALLIVVAAGIGAGHICSTAALIDPSLYKDPGNPADRRGLWPSRRPQLNAILSANDASRWATVRALVDNRTFAVGRRDPVQGDAGIIFTEGWSSIDVVLNPKTQEFFSSKPPLLPTLVAGLYWLLKKLLGWTLARDTFAVVRTILILVNLVPFVIYLWLLARILRRYAVKEWSRLFVFSAACFATLVTPFLITLNNHTVATFSVVFALYPVLPLFKLPLRPGASDVLPSPIAFAASGLLASFTACMELPAAAFLAALGGVLWWIAPRRTLLFFVPAALIPLSCLVALDYAALGEFLPARTKFGGQWYEYPGSYWNKPEPGTVKYGIDWAWMHEGRAAYAFNTLVGHHGLFSLSPIWLLAVAGVFCAGWNLRRLLAKEPGSKPTSAVDTTLLAALTFLVSAVVLGFYWLMTDNYGGWTNGLRWLMWLTPLWLLTMLPVVDWLGERRWGRWLAVALLAWSVFSVSFRPWTPWQHPWLFDLLDSGGYIPY